MNTPTHTDPLKNARGGTPRVRKGLTICTGKGMIANATRTRRPPRSSDDFKAATVRNLKRVIAACQQTLEEIEREESNESDFDGDGLR